MNLLGLVQAATGELGLSQPSAVATATDDQTKQLLALINKVGNDVISVAEWEGISKENRFSTVSYTVTGDTTAGSAIVTSTDTTGTGLAIDTFEVIGGSVPTDTTIASIDSTTQITMSNPASEAETGVSLTFSQTQYALPSDYDRMKNRTSWDQTNYWAMQGPQSPQEWAYLKSGIIANTPRLRFRILGSKFNIFPASAGVVRLKFEYTSNGWVEAADGTAKTIFTLDTDTCIFRDRTIISGLKYEFFKIKGFDTDGLWRDYQIQQEFEKGIDKGAPTLSMSDRGGSLFLGNSSIPDSGFGS
jgi:hypothetical protein|tara:strand:- start:363 stop:1268 length:906 start_codon:yes stop_codon:yes gene_type:complete